jgi:hypothetical protein
MGLPGMKTTIHETTLSNTWKNPISCDFVDRFCGWLGISRKDAKHELKAQSEDRIFAPLVFLSAFARNFFPSSNNT